MIVDGVVTQIANNILDRNHTVRQHNKLYRGRPKRHRYQKHHRIHTREDPALYRGHQRHDNHQLHRLPRAMAATAHPE
jgi:hypothetical protein